LKSGSLKLLEPSGPVQACNGTAAPYKRSEFLLYEILFFILEDRVLVHTIFELPVSNVQSRKTNFVFLNKPVGKKQIFVTF